MQRLEDVVHLLLVMLAFQLQVFMKSKYVCHIEVDVCIIGSRYCSMAPKAKSKAEAKAKAKVLPPPSIDAASLQATHGIMLSQSPYAQCPSPFLLHKALHSRVPAVQVSMGVVKHWWTQHRAGTRADVSNTQELNDKHRDRLMTWVLV